MPIHLSQHERVGVVTMDMPRANTIGRAFVAQMNEILDEIEADPRTSAAVLTGRGRAFSTGLDLAEVSGMDRPAMTRFTDDFDNMLAMVFTFPKPVVAALNGHAVAGGFLLACATHGRLAANGAFKVGLTPILDGLPFPPVAYAIARHAGWPPAEVAGGLASRLLTPKEAAADGLVKLAEVGNADSLAARAIDMAQGLALQAEVLRREGHLAKVDLASGRGRFVDAWLSPVASGRVLEARRKLYETSPENAATPLESQQD